MSNKPVKLYFLGSGDIGVDALETLCRAEAIQVLGVGTQPDRPSGRHRLPHGTAIAFAAEACRLPVDKPASVNTPEFLGHLRELGPDVLFVASFGQILKPPLLELAPFGCLNLHASLLPRHRGASPIHAAILAGDSETGVTLMRMDAGLDTGPTYCSARLALNGHETTPELERALGRLAAGHVVEWIRGVCREGWQPTPQPAAGVTHARKIRKEQARLDWRLPAVALERQVRAYQPWPRSWLELVCDHGTRRVQVVGATVIDGAGGGPGEVLQADEHAWAIACGEQALRLDRVIPEGRGEMAAAEFLRGARVCPGVGALH